MERITRRLVVLDRNKRMVGIVSATWLPTGDDHLVARPRKRSPELAAPGADVPDYELTYGTSAAWAMPCGGRD